MPKIFISYSHNDAPGRIDTLMAELRRTGVLTDVESFTDVSPHSASGALLKDEIRSAIASASKVVILWTDAGSRSQWVNYEAGIADALGKPIVVAIPEGSPVDVPDSLSNAQIVRIKPGG